MILRMPLKLLSELLASPPHTWPPNVIERSIEIMVRAAPSSPLDAFVSTIPGNIESRVLAKHANAASLLEQHPERLVSLLDGPPLRMTMVLRRALRLQWFDHLIAAAPRIALRIEHHFPFDELERWGEDALDECARLCRSFGWRHPVLHQAIARTHPSEFWELADEYWDIQAEDWNGGRVPRPRVMPWAYGSLIAAAADAGERDIARALLERISNDWKPERAEAIGLIAVSAARADAFDEAAPLVGELSEIALDHRAILTVEAIALFAKCARDVPRFADEAMSSKRSPKGGAHTMLTPMFAEAIAACDDDTARELVEVMRPAHGFPRFEERRRLWGREVLRLLEEQERYEEAFEWAERIPELAPRGFLVGMAYRAALRGQDAWARELLRGSSDQLTRTLKPLLAALDGGPFVPESDLTIRERMYWLLFELESKVGHSVALGRDIASFEAPKIRPRATATPECSSAPSVRLVATEPKNQMTFRELGIPFSLYEAKVDSCSRYVGRGMCALDQVERAHCFEVDELIADCTHCGARTSSQDKCPGCGRAIDSPHDFVIVGYEAIMEGRAGFVIDTELGMVTNELASQGRTHGAQQLDRRALSNNAFELCSNVSDEEPWVYALVPSERLMMLTRTPPYTSWQGEMWLFHCGQPMVFIGELTRAEVEQRELAPDARDLLARMDVAPEDEGFMTFRCACCGMHRFHEDTD